MTAPSLPALGAGRQWLSKHLLHATAHLLTGAAAGTAVESTSRLLQGPSPLLCHLASFSLAFFAMLVSCIIEICITHPHIYYSLAFVVFSDAPSLPTHIPGNSEVLSPLHCFALLPSGDGVCQCPLSTFRNWPDAES